MATAGLGRRLSQAFIVLVTLFAPLSSFAFSPLLKNPSPSVGLSASVPSSSVAEHQVMADSKDFCQQRLQPSINHENKLKIVQPSGAFRNTTLGEISIVSHNVLAPTYSALGHPDEETRVQVAEIDRMGRYLRALSMSKRTNPDILCLQEVEGGQDELEALLKEHLAKDTENDKGKVPGYDSHVWSPLLPNRREDVVGLCVAWRSSRHRLVSCECFRRGMVVQLAELETGATIVLANLHLPAKPSAIEGRLRSMASALRRMQTCESVSKTNRWSPSSSSSPSGLDGLAVVAGDFNCGHNAPVLKLLKTGYSLYGTLKDRNYKAKISKRSAAAMKHAFRFKDVYEDLRFDIAPITVSLKGRGPGSMDHMLFSTGADESRKALTVSSSTIKANNEKPQRLRGRRQARRDRGLTRSTRMTSPVQQGAQAFTRNAPNVRLDSVLATIDSRNSKEWLETFEKGLPNENVGFYSDHLPVGALFVSQEADAEHNVGCEDGIGTGMSGSDGGQQNRVSTSTLSQRRSVYRESLGIRRRHNKILRCISEFLLENQATDMIRDVPLYKWKWLAGSNVRLGKKMRAPDLCCIIGGELVICEVTVSSKKPGLVYREKLSKYQDVFEALTQSDKLQEMGLRVSHGTKVFVVDAESGLLHTKSAQDLERLVGLCGVEKQDEVCKSLQDVICGIAQDGKAPQG